MNQQRITYPSDLSDEKWNQVKLLVSSQNQRGRNRSIDLREIVDSINYRWSTGCVWRMLPHDFPKWETVYFYFNRWKNDGTLSRIREIVLARGVLKQTSLNSPVFQAKEWNKPLKSYSDKELGKLNTFSQPGNRTQKNSSLPKGTIKKFTDERETSSWKLSRNKNNFPAESSRSA